MIIENTMTTGTEKALTWNIGRVRTLSSAVIEVVRRHKESILVTRAGVLLLVATFLYTATRMFHDWF